MGSSLRLARATNPGADCYAIPRSLSDREAPRLQSQINRLQEDGWQLTLGSAEPLAQSATPSNSLACRVVGANQGCTQSVRLKWQSSQLPLGYRCNERGMLLWIRRRGASVEPMLCPSPSDGISD